MTERLVESNIEIDFKPGATVGITLSTDNPPKITKLLPSSAFLGKLFVGDIIVSINDVKVANFCDILKASKSGPKLNFRIKRDEYCTCKVNTLPAPKPGYEAFEFEMNWRTGGMPIGILVYQDSEKRVIVSMIESGTLASTTLKPGDHLTKVNDTVIVDKSMAKKMILDSVNAQNKVKLTCERRNENANATPVAVTPPASNPKLPNFDLPLPADVLAILEANKTFHKQPYSATSILKPPAPGSPATPASPGNGKNINMPEVPPEEQQIEFDPSPKPLRVTPKRVGAA
uniref:PDZ domain-containing protein n=1 Tax=Panagrellus redivivus TaxID=6233 RepID=A0A7E4VJ01_PANRE